MLTSDLNSALGLTHTNPICYRAINILNKYILDIILDISNIYLLQFLHLHSTFACAMKHEINVRQDLGGRHKLSSVEENSGLVGDRLYPRNPRLPIRQWLPEETAYAVLSVAFVGRSEMLHPQSTPGDLV